MVKLKNFGERIEDYYCTKTNIVPIIFDPFEIKRFTKEVALFILSKYPQVENRTLIENDPDYLSKAKESKLSFWKMLKFYVRSRIANSK